MALIALLRTPVNRGLIAPIRPEHLVEVYLVLHHGPTESHHDIVRGHPIGTVHADFRDLGDSP